MSGPTAGWAVRLSELALGDVRDIAVWTHNTFGAAQAETYSDALSLTLERLLGGPQVVGVRQRSEISKGLFSLRVRVKRRQGRHSIFFRAEQGEILIVRILHDAMDVDRQLGDK